MRDLFRRYLDTRISAYQNVDRMAVARAKLAEAEALQGVIWEKAITACRRPDAAPPATMLLLPALNEMIDITTTRMIAAQNHPPKIVFVLLVGLSLLASLLVGYDAAGNKRRTWLHTTAFAIIMSLAVYVILDLEYPRLGLIRIDAADQAFHDLRKTMQ